MEREDAVHDCRRRGEPNCVSLSFLGIRRWKITPEGEGGRIKKDFVTTLFTHAGVCPFSVRYGRPDELEVEILYAVHRCIEVRKVTIASSKRKQELT
jgi:hypothetical protein